MIPILYETTETAFTSNGIGRLSDAISCIVTEERNGPYELEMQYPITGQYFDELTHSRIIFAAPADGKSGQPFRIYRIEKPLDGICTIYAEHISYQLNHIPVMPFQASTCAEALARLVTYAGQACPFTVWTDKTVAAQFSVTEPRAFRELLGGSSGSILDVYGKGEYEFDKYLVRLYVNRGNDTGVTIRYAKNLTDLVNDENIEETYTGVCPFWKDSETGTLVTLPEISLWADTAANYPYKRTKIVDFSDEWESAPTVAQLRARTQTYIDANNIGIPKVNIDVEFVPLWQTSGASLGQPELNLVLDGATVNGNTVTGVEGTVTGDTVYLSNARFSISRTEYQALERVNLCDTVTIIYDALGVSATAKVIKTVYNVLKDRYDSIEVGDAKTTLASQIIGIEQEIERNNVSLDISDELKAYVDHQTNLISGGLGGYVVLNPNADGEPQEILIMDSDDMNTAVNVIRMNKNGIGFSTTGYSGPYTSAWTIDGIFNADFIGAGQMSGAYVKAHTISAAHMTISDPTNFVTVLEQYQESMLDSDNVLGGTIISGGYVGKSAAANGYLAMSDIMAAAFVYGDQLYYEFEAFAPSTKTVQLGVILYDDTQTEVERFYTPEITLTTSTRVVSGTLYLDYVHWDENGLPVFNMATISGDTMALPNGAVSNGTLTFSHRDSEWVYYAIVLIDSSGTQVYYRRAVVRRKNGGTLIVDGSITAEKIAAGAITASKIAAGAITAGNIDLYGKMGVYTDSSLSTNGGYIGYMSGSTYSGTTDGIAIMDSASKNFMIATTSGVRMTNGSGSTVSDLYIANGLLRYVSSGVGGVYLQGNVYLNTANGTAYSGAAYLGPDLYIKSASGTTLVQISSATGEYGEIAVLNSDGHTLVYVGRQNTHGFIGVSNSSGVRRAQMGVNADGYGNLWVRNASNNQVATLTANENGAALYLFDSASTPANRATLYTTASGGYLQLVDTTASAILTRPMISRLGDLSTGYMILSIANYNYTTTSTVEVGSAVAISISITAVSGAAGYIIIPARLLNCVVSVQPTIGTNNILTAALQNVSSIATTLSCTFQVIAYK